MNIEAMEIKDDSADKSNAPQHHWLLLALGSLGVVYGDIGTSPLYAVRECFSSAHGLPVTEANVLGVMSLILWSLILVVTVKYLMFVMRADRHGEGGVLVLMTLTAPSRFTRKFRWPILFMGLFGAGLLYGDGMITPAISVLSAVEGLEVATAGMHAYVVPIALIILLLLFSIQNWGTNGVAKWFGPLMLLWFFVIALLGVRAIVHQPGVLWAVNPVLAVRFFLVNGHLGLTTMGIVFLVVTGSEAVYADMGHFGLSPIRRAWLVVVLPSLVLNYFGQGALLLSDASAVSHPFYLLAPQWGLYPLVLLSTVATVIASQAVISGAFSLTSQAIELGYCPQLEVRHTSIEEPGQVYVPAINWGLCAAVIGLVLVFRSSGNLAGAYGIAITTTMIITSTLMYIVARRLWNWPRYVALLVCGLFLLFDLGFFAANVTKIPEGGWFPLLVGLVVCFVMVTWRMKHPASQR
ncbi:MAG: KUP/HAK/KT family potassium transporter [Planctomycetaceae bacterium]|nr:KUP/HAK/KT family potassium transporter [Planctomycetaceae bacterium]